MEPEEERGIRARISSELRMTLHDTVKNCSRWKEDRDSSQHDEALSVRKQK